MSVDGRHQDERSNPVRGDQPYVALVARHQDQLRREMLARIDKRTAASRVTWTVASRVASRITYVVTNRVATPLARRVTTTLANRVTTTLAIATTMLFALATTAGPKPSRDRDDIDPGGP